MVKKGLAVGAGVAVLVAGLVLSQRGAEPLKVSGFIEADEIRIGSRVGGRVARVHAVEGQPVRAGQVLVELEPFDLLERRAQAAAELAARQADVARLSAGFRAEEIAQAKARRDQWAARVDKLVHGPRAQEIEVAAAQLRLAEAEHRLAQLEHERTRALFEKKAAPQQDLDQATSKLQAAQAAVEARQATLSELKEGTRPEDIAEAKAHLEEATQAWQLTVNGYRPEDLAAAKAAQAAAEAALRVIDRQIEELQIKATVDGTVEAVELQPGDLVAANTPAISLLDSRGLWVRAYVPENRLNIPIGRPVAVTVDSFPGRRFAGRVSFVARQAEFTPGNVQTPEERSKQVFRIKVVLDEGLEVLRPGMAADVWLEP